ncbi:hypothetical protein [Paenibacillus sp.]|uniref:hypothetical protein n=1 Tax=Paenibacillus sp. TaxID=58172 RepID=UPI002811DF01|nr:hypothetical protein [Paenibacillus sp.]
MKVTNLLQLTEHHRYVVSRRFGLSPLDSRLLWTAYQPMIGGTAVALYTTLYSALASDAVGDCDAGTLGQLFLACGLPPNERGRKQLVDETAKLEAVGLLQTFRRMDGDEVAAYEFRLQPPLRPDQFFGVHHLWLLLQEKLGPNGAEAVRRSFAADGGIMARPADHETLEDISAPFYEVFRMTVGAAALAEEPTELVEPPASQAGGEFGRDGFRGDELLRRFPRSHAHRRAMERLVADPARLAELNYHAGRFELTLKQTVSLLDEDGMFAANGEWVADRFQARAAEVYRGSNEQAMRKERTTHKQAVARESEASAAASALAAERDVSAPYWLEVPEQFQGQCDVRQYNAMLANSPYTRVLKMFFQPSAVPTAVEEAFLTMKVNYQLPDEVLNVMIHYIRANDLDWKRNYLDAIAGNVAGKRIRSFENAVTYFRKAEQSRASAGAAGRTGEAGSAGAGAAPQRAPQARRGRPPGTAKPVIPVAKSSDTPEATEEDIMRMMEMAKRLTNG